MWREKSPGLKILWIWTFGTAAVLVASVVRTRIRDMDHFLSAAAESPHDTGDTPNRSIYMVPLAAALFRFSVPKSSAREPSNVPETVFSDGQIAI